MATKTIEIGVQLVTIGCCVTTCGIVFAVPVDWEREKRRDRTSWTCPNAHSQHYTAKSEEEELREKLQEAERSLDWNRGERKRLAEDNMTLARSKRALRGVVTRLKNKAVAGECAWCHQQFPDVAEHVAEAHPGVVADATETDEEPEG